MSGARPIDFAEMQRRLQSLGVVAAQTNSCLKFWREPYEMTRFLTAGDYQGNDRCGRGEEFVCEVRGKLKADMSGKQLEGKTAIIYWRRWRDRTRGGAAVCLAQGGGEYCRS